MISSKFDLCLLLYAISWQIGSLARLHLRAVAVCQACGHPTSSSTSSLASTMPYDDVQRAFSTGQVPQSWKTSLVSPWSVQSSSRGTSHTQSSTGQSQWVRSLADFMLASQHSARSSTQSKSSYGPPVRQAIDLSLALSILPSPFSML